MLSKKHLCGKEKLEKKWKEELIKSQQEALEKFVFKIVDTINGTNTKFSLSRNIALPSL
jgi:hypothetical protein